MPCSSRSAIDGSVYHREGRVSPRFRAAVSVAKLSGDWLIIVLPLDAHGGGEGGRGSVLLEEERRAVEQAEGGAGRVPRKPSSLDVVHGMDRGVAADASRSTAFASSAEGRVEGRLTRRW